jgi:O-antigen/teichoic acid export membrane protein
VVASVPWLAVAAVGAVLCVPIAHFLHLSSVVPVLLAGLLFAVVILAAIPAGLLIGQRRFPAIAWLGIVAVAVRLGGGTVVGRTGDTVSAALIASLIPIVLVSVATLVVSLRGSTTVHATSANAPSSAGLAVDAAAGALLSAGLWGIWSLPLLAVRHDLPAVDAGIFAALQLVVGGSLFLTGPIVTVFHPTIARTRQPRTIVAGGVATLAVAAAASLALIAIGPWVISAVYGRGYQGDRRVLAALCLSASCVALATYVLWVSRALQRSTRPVGVGVCLAVLIEAAFMAVSHGSIIALALSPAVSIAGGAALVLVGTRWRALATADRRARSSADRTSTRDRSPLLREGPG